MNKFLIALLLIAFLAGGWFLICGILYLVFHVAYWILRPVLILTLISSAPLLLILHRR